MIHGKGSGEKGHGVTRSSSDLLDWPELMQNIADEIMGEIDLDELQEEIRDAVLSELDVNALRGEIMESVRRAFGANT